MKWELIGDSTATWSYEEPIVKEEIKTEEEFIEGPWDPKVQPTRSEIMNEEELSLKQQREVLEEATKCWTQNKIKMEDIELKEELIEFNWERCLSENKGPTFEGGPKSTTGEIENKLENMSKSSEREADGLGIKSNLSTQRSWLDDKNSGDDHVADKTKSFKCNDCGRSFKSKQIINRHIISVHENHKPHKCPYCEYACSLKGNLSKHISSVHEKFKPHKCPRCEYAFSEKGSLSKHIISVHEKLKPHSCPHCKYAFSYKVALLYHIKSVHETLNPLTPEFFSDCVPYCRNYFRFIEDER